jgi:hypothetical protein
MNNFIKLIILVFFMTGIHYSCIPTPFPSLYTAPVANITDSSCTCGGTISDEGLSPIIERGVCWSTKPDPDMKDNKTSDGTGTGTFTSNIPGLKKATTYYMKAYAINDDQTGYGNEVSFTTLDY